MRNSIVGMAILGALIGSTAHAEEVSEPSAASAALEEVVVTSRKVAENLQRVPLAVTALSGEALAEKSLGNIGQISAWVPNARFRAHFSDPTAMVLQIRGQTQTDVVVTLDPSVGTYIDGVYWTRGIGSNAALLDVERAEVLRGPQGTLFGRNTTGGALNIKTKDPSFDGVNGQVTLRGGDHGMRQVTAVGNFPLVGDRLALRVAGSTTNFGGYGRDRITGSALNDYDSWIGRAKLLYQATDTLRILLSAEKYGFDGAGSSPALIFAAVPSAAANQVIAQSGGTDTISRYVFNGSGDPYDVSSGFRPYNKVSAQTFSGTAVQEFGNNTLTAIIAYRSYDSRRNENMDGTPYGILKPNQTSAGHQSSQELQWTGGARAEAITWTAGLFHLDERIPRDFEASFALTSLNPNTPARSIGEVNNSTSAIYGQGNLQLDSRWSLTAGLRYSKDEKQLISRNNTGPNAVCSVPVVMRPDPAVCASNQRRSDSGWSYTLSANFQWTDGALLYAKTSRAFRGGGFQLRGGSTVTDFTPFKPETVTDYEIGAKMESANRKVRFNAAAFYSDNKDVQRSTNVPRAGGGISSIISNAATAHVTGLEAELAVRATASLEFGGSLGLTEPRYDKFVDARGDRSAEKFENVPKVTAAAYIRHSSDLPVGELIAQADYSYTGMQVQSRNTKPPYTENPGYGLVNLRFTLKPTSSNFEVAAYATNLLDKRYKFATLDLFGPGLGVISGFYGPPRQIGMEASYRFGQ